MKGAASAVRARRSGARRTTSRSRSRSVQPRVRGRAQAGVPRRPRSGGRSRPSTTSRGATRTTSRTSTWPRAISSMRSAGRTTCLRRAHRGRARAHPRVARRGTPASSTTTSRPARASGSTSPRTTTSSPPPVSAVAALALMGESPTRRAGPRSRARIIIARDSCSAPTATTTRGSSTGSSRRRGSCTSWTPGSTRPARACGSAGPSRLEALPRARAAARRPERLRLRRHLGGRAHAREGRARSTRGSTRAARCRATST